MDLHKVDLRRTEPVRLYVYGILAPLLGVAVLLGLISEAEAQTWVTLGVTVAGLVFGTEAARSRAYAPATVHPDPDELTNDQGRHAG